MSRRRAAVAPMYFDANDDDDHFVSSSQQSSSQRADSSSTRRSEAEDVRKDDDSLLEENAFARYKLKSNGGGKINPLKALKNSQPALLDSDLVAPAQKAASQKEKVSKQNSRSAVGGGAVSVTVASTAIFVSDSPVKIVSKSTIPSAEQLQSAPSRNVAPIVEEDDTGDDIMIEDEHLLSPIRSKNAIVESVASRTESEPGAGHLTDESNSPAAKTCYVCHKSLDNLDIQAQEFHINKCLDGHPILGDEDNNPPPQPDASAAGGLVSVDGRTLCIMCGMDISKYNQQRRLQHLDRCAEKLPRDGDGTMTGERYACVLCKMDLSDSDTSNRIKHIKKCASKNGVSVSDMGRIMAESSVAARMPQNIASARPRPAPSIPGAPKTAVEENIQLAMAISASEKPPASTDMSQFSSGGLSIDSQHDLAGFRNSQYHIDQKNRPARPVASSTASQLAKLPFEDDDALASQMGSDDAPAMVIPSALASKYSRNGGSPRKLNLWHLQGMDSVSAFGSSPNRSSPKITRVIPSTAPMENDDEPLGHAIDSPQLSPVKQRNPRASGSSSGDALPVGTAFQMASQTGAGAVDALVELFDIEDALEDRDPTTGPRRRLHFEQQQEQAHPNTDIETSTKPSKKKKRNRSSPSEIAAVDHIDVDDDDEPEQQQVIKKTKISSSSSSDVPVVVGDSVSPALESAVVEVVQSCRRRFEELREKYVQQIKRIQNEYSADMDRISQDKEAQINRLLNAHASPLSLLQRQDIRQRAERASSSLSFPEHDNRQLIHHPAVIDYDSAVTWSNNVIQHRPLPPTPPPVDNPNDASIMFIDMVGVNDSSPEFKTPPPRMPTARRSAAAGPPAPVAASPIQESGLDDSIFEPHLNPNAPADAVDLPGDSSVVYSSSSPPLPDISSIPDGETDVSYSKMSFAELKAKAAEFGIKTSLSKQQLIEQLERIRRAQQSVLMSPRTAEAAEIQRAGLLSSPAPPSSSQPSQRLAGGIDIVYTRNNSSNEDLYKRMVTAIRSDRALWSRILKFQSVELEDVKASLLRSRIKVSKEFIKEFCVDKGVNLAKVQRTKD